MALTAKDIRTGVLYEANPRDLEPYASRVDRDFPYNQSYGQYLRFDIPETDDGNKAGQSWMVDTYDISCSDFNVGGNTQNTVDALTKASDEGDASSWFINKIQFDHYYCSAVQLTDETAQWFTEYCDLHEFGARNGRNPNHYEGNDVVESVHLYFEHGYSMYIGDCGVTLIRKDATPHPLFTIQERYRHMREYSNTGKLDTYELSKLENVVYENRDNPEIIEQYMTIMHYVDKCVAAKQASKALDGAPHAYNQLQIPGLEDDDGYY